MRIAEGVFVDTGAWVALALARDPYHERACLAWRELLENGARFHTSIPVVLETFTFLDRNATRDVALTWKDRLVEVPFLKRLECSEADLESAWAYFRDTRLHRLSAVDATSFVLMEKAGLRLAFAFDHHFAVVGFSLVG